MSEAVPELYWPDVEPDRRSGRADDAGNQIARTAPANRPAKKCADDERKGFRNDCGPNFALSGQTGDDQFAMTRNADEGESGLSNAQLKINDEVGTLRIAALRSRPSPDIGHSPVVILIMAFLVLTSLLKIIGIVFLIILPMVSYSVYAERRVSALIQDRLGPNRTASQPPCLASRDFTLSGGLVNRGRRHEVHPEGRFHAATRKHLLLLARALPRDGAGDHDHRGRAFW